MTQVSLQMSDENLSTQIASVTAGTGKQVHLWLFTDVVMVGQKPPLMASMRSVSWVGCQVVHLVDVVDVHAAKSSSSTEDVSAAACVFVIKGRGKSFTIRACSVAEKKDWVSAIREQCDKVVMDPHSVVPVARLVESAPQWMEDDDSKVCMRCDRPWGMMFRRHHCRRCGQLVCSACSQHRRRLGAYLSASGAGTRGGEEKHSSPSSAGEHPSKAGKRVRVCDACNILITRERLGILGQAEARSSASGGKATAVPLRLHEERISLQRKLEAQRARVSRGGVNVAAKAAISTKKPALNDGPSDVVVPNTTSILTAARPETTHTAALHTTTAFERANICANTPVDDVFSELMQDKIGLQPEQVAQSRAIGVSSCEMVLGMTKEELQEWTALIFEGSGSEISFGQRIALRQWRDGCSSSSAIPHRDGVGSSTITASTCASTATNTASSSPTSNTVRETSVPEDNSLDVSYQAENKEEQPLLIEDPVLPSVGATELSAQTVKAQIRARLDAIELIMLDGEVLSDMENDSDSSWVTDSSASEDNYDIDREVNEGTSNHRARTGKLRARQARIEYVSSEDTDTEESSEPDSD